MRPVYHPGEAGRSKNAIMNGFSADAAARIEMRGIQAAGFAAGALAPVAPRATVLVLFAVFAVLAGLAILRRVRPPCPHPTSLIGFGVLVLWMGLSAVWSPVPGQLLKAAISVAVLVATGLLVTQWVGRTAQQNDRLQRPAANGVLAGLAVGIAIYAFEEISSGWITRLVHGYSWRDIIDETAGGINYWAKLINGTAILSLLVWPALAARRHGADRWIAPLLGGLICVATALFGSDTGLIALFVGAVCWGAAMRWGARAVRGGAILFAVVVLTTPIVLHRALQSPDFDRFVVERQETLPNSALVRLYIWKFTTDRIFERPFLGWGFDSARRIPGGGDKFLVKDRRGRTITAELNLPLHPHNQILQIWLELGAIGAFIVAVAGGLLIDGLGRRESRIRASGLALAGTAIVYDLLSFGAWQSWWIAAVFVAAALLSAMASPGVRA